MKPCFFLLRISIALTTVLGTIGCSDDERVSREARAITSAERDLAGVVHGNNLFALGLYDELRKQESGNVFFSPFSISAAFGMTYAGAKGETAEQMREVLRLQVEDDAFHDAFGALMADLAGPKYRGYELSIANRLFGQKDFSFRDEFLALAANAYGAPLEPIDFAADPRKAREHVNAWVAEMTRGRIEDLLSENDVTVDTRLVLANAIYFEAQWAKAFDPERTYDGMFFVDDDTTVTVPMMSQSQGEFAMASNEWVSALELPYRDDEVAMLVLLPQQFERLEEFERVLTLEMVDELIASLKPRETTIMLPKFEIAYELPLKDALIAMGMTNVFDEGDFSKIADGIALAHATHKAFVEVDEQGTKAAAATAGIANLSGGFMVNRPFLFLIRDKLTGSILFLGRVTNPAAD